MDNNLTTIYKTSEPQKHFSLGIIAGSSIGLFYVVLLFIKFKFFTYSPIAFNSFTFASYASILILYFLVGYTAKKKSGGYGEAREIFLPIFISILIAEFCYILFNYLYIAFIDPEFMNNYIQTTLKYLTDKGIESENIDYQMEKMTEQASEMKNFRTSAMGFGLWVIIDSIICLVFTLALRKPRLQN